MTVTGERLIASIRAHAAKNPNFVYQGGPDPRVHDAWGTVCSYMLDGKPSCIVGHALFDLDLIDQAITLDLNVAPFRDVVFALGIDISPEEKFWIASVQNHQDLGFSWGESVIAADKASLEEVLRAGV